MRNPIKTTHSKVYQSRHPWIQQLTSNPYNRLLSVLIVFLFSRPLWQNLLLDSLIYAGITLILLIIIISGNFLEQRSQRLFLILAGLAFLTQLLGFSEIAQKLLMGNDQMVISMGLISAGLVTNAAFLAAAVYSITLHLFSESRVTGDTLKGGISGYLLMGLLWNLLYNLAVLWDSNSLLMTCNDCQLDTLYFSFTTLSTLGYGDIIPATAWTRSLSNLEAITGLMYPTIFIARLVGLYSRIDE